MHKFFLTFFSALTVFCLDQATKIYIHANFELGDSVSIIPNFFRAQYVRNQGGAFGMFSDSNEMVRFVLFLIFPLVCLYFIFSLIKETKSRLEVLCLGGILGGALGNYLDRVRMGYVVDFIDVYIGDFHWPTFNLADSFIVMGVGVLIALQLLEYLKKKQGS